MGISGRFEQATVNQVQQANDIVELINEHVSLTKKGGEMVGLCPFHDDHRPSMCVNGAKQIFKCFACGAGGDVFKFVQMRENLSFPQAIERLAERAGIKLKPARFTKTQPLEISPNKLAKVNAWAAEYFERNLADEQKGKYARDYLAKRQITPQSAKKWQLGLAVGDDQMLKEAKALKAPVELLIKAGLVTAQHCDRFVNRLMFTITDVTGRIIGFGGRTLDDKGAKYINSPATPLFDKSNSLYGLQQARHQIVSTDTAVVVEGYTDCIMAHQSGCGNVVATLGTSFTAGQARILKRYAKKVVLIFDSDTAGIEAANRAMEVCLLQRIDIKLASVPQGKDPCDFLLTAGKERFEQLVNEAVDVFQFKWNRLIENFGNDETIAGKKAAIEEFLQTIAIGLQAGRMTAIEQGLIVNRLSKIIGAEPKQINAELGRILKRTQKSSASGIENKTASADLGQGLLAAAQRELLEILLNAPNLLETVKQKLTAENFDVPILRQTADVLFEVLKNEPEAPLAVILARAESVELGRCIVELAGAGEEKGNFQARLDGALNVMQRYGKQIKVSEIKEKQGQRKFLQNLCENAGKQNPHSLGMT